MLEDFKDNACHAIDTGISSGHNGNRVGPGKFDSLLCPFYLFSHRAPDHVFPGKQRFKRIKIQGIANHIVSAGYYLECPGGHVFPASGPKADYGKAPFFGSVCDGNRDSPVDFLFHNKLFSFCHGKGRWLGNTQEPDLCCPGRGDPALCVYGIIVKEY